MQAPAAGNPLLNRGILQQVFLYLPGNYLFFGGVCREWRAVSAGMAHQRVRRVSLDSRSVGFVTYGPTGTLCSAALASPATARWAASCGLVCMLT
jgi:hypothetical protein